jgi:hypothetical protein
VTASCSCARAFLRARVAACGDALPARGGTLHCIMNLPQARCCVAPLRAPPAALGAGCGELTRTGVCSQDAPEFLDCFRGAFSPAVWRPEASARRTPSRARGPAQGG